MKRKIVFAVLIILAVVSALAGVKALQIRKMVEVGKSFEPPPETVSAFVARQEKWQSSLSAIATVTASQGVDITPEIPGAVRDIAFESGSIVAKGDLLVRLDTSSEEAELRAIQAQVSLASINVERARKLRKENIAPQSDLDTAEATLKQNQGNADTVQATIAKKTIRAPFAGRLGIRLINLGQYLEAGKPIVSLQALTPIYANFSLPQQELSKLKTDMQVRLRTDASPGKEFEGILTVINPGLDETTRSVGLQATFANEEQLLRPGMFAKLEVVLPEIKDVLVIPATSVLSEPYGDSVYVIEPKTSSKGRPGFAVRRQLIKSGGGRGDFLSVESGLKPGERVVSAGVFKLRNGAAVVENNNIVPQPSISPKPADT
jgi:membrane fusion protein (multidrug efflux system)